MLRNYLTVGLRALTKNRAYAAINILGLAIGMAACLLILLFVQDQLSYDRFFPNAGRIYQLQAFFNDPDTGREQKWQSTPWASGPALTKDFPQIEHAAYLDNTQPVVMDKGQPRTFTVAKVGADFLTIFHLDFIAGNPARALPDMNAVALSATKAVALFGTPNAVGRTLTTITYGERRDYRVTGVFRDMPRNSHLRLGAIALQDVNSMSEAERTSWGNFNGYNYVQLRPGTDVSALNAQMAAWEDRNAPKRVQDGKLVSDVASVTFRLVALPDIHLGEGKGGPAGNEGDRRTVVTFAILAVLILVMACVNFTNLATARASQRAREVALRKVLGATRAQLVLQFLGESVLVTAIAMLLSLAMVELLLPWLRHFLDAGIPLHYLGRGGVLLPAVALTVGVGIASGLYPALYLTRFQPAAVLKANRSTEAAGSGRLRGVLVVVQFAISIGLIICTITVYAQTVYARSADPGFRRAGVLQIGNADASSVQQNIRALTAEIARVPGVRSVARTRIAVNTHSRSNNNAYLPGRSTPLILGSFDVGYNYVETMGMRVRAGRTLSESRAGDDATTGSDAEEQALARAGMNVVVNMSAAHQLGIRDPADAIGKQFRFDFIEPRNGGTVPATIVGVVGDTRYFGPDEKPLPLVFYHDEHNLDYLVVRVDTRNAAAVRDRVAAVWRRIAPTVPFEASFADDEARALTQAEAAMAQMFSAFAVLSVVIGCLGLFGLAAFTAERRTKEIGIRKVLGARTRDIVRLLVWQFSRPVLIANLIAWPVAWWAMRDWLNRFDARMPLGPGPFVLAGGLALVIAIATIAGHALRVARANPIVALRYE